jgi:5-methylcytosine-specific restriction endonuclease McrA
MGNRWLLLTLCFSAHLAEARIPRDRSEVRAFRAENPCPATGLKRGACPGWEVDHSVPLCAGGEDRRSNMVWLSKEDHRWKTFVDVRECRKLRRMAETPAVDRRSHAN